MEIVEKKSAGGIVLRGREVLTLYVPDHDETVFPKGTIEEGETSETAAVREVLEETGYHTEIVARLSSSEYEFEEGGKHFRKTVVFYLMRLLDEDETAKPQPESHEVFENLWLDSREAMNRLTHDANKSLLQQALGLTSSLQE